MTTAKSHAELEAALKPHVDERASPGAMVAPPGAPLLQPTAARLEELARPSIEQGRIVVIGGYIGATASGITTTLGRGGSDYTAAIVGAYIRISTNFSIVRTESSIASMP